MFQANESPIEFASMGERYCQMLQVWAVVNTECFPEISEDIINIITCNLNLNGKLIILIHKCFVTQTKVYREVKALRKKVREV